MAPNAAIATIAHVNGFLIDLRLKDEWLRTVVFLYLRSLAPSRLNYQGLSTGFNFLLKRTRTAREKGYQDLVKLNIIKNVNKGAEIFSAIFSKITISAAIINTLKQLSMFYEYWQLQFSAR